MSLCQWSAHAWRTGSFPCNLLTHEESHHPRAPAGTDPRQSATPRWRALARPPAPAAACCICGTDRIGTPSNAAAGTAGAPGTGRRPRTARGTAETRRQTRRETAHARSRRRRGARRARWRGRRQHRPRQLRWIRPPLASRGVHAPLPRQPQPPPSLPRAPPQHHRRRARAASKESTVVVLWPQRSGVRRRRRATLHGARPRQRAQARITRTRALGPQGGREPRVPTSASRARPPPAVRAASQEYTLPARGGGEPPVGLARLRTRMSAVTSSKSAPQQQPAASSAAV